MFSPRFIFLSLWLSQILLHLVFHDVFYPFFGETWFVILWGGLAFVAGTFFCQLLISQMNFIYSEEKRIYMKMDAVIKWFLIIYIPLFFYILFSVRDILYSMGLSDFNAPVIRQLVIDDFNGDRLIYDKFRFLYTGIGFCIFFLAFSSEISKKNIFMLIVLGLISSLATTGRLFLLLFFSSTVALLYRNKIISIKSVCGFFLAFVLLFFGVAIFLGKGSETNGVEIGSGILWNAQVYIMSSISCFNDYVGGGVADFDGSILIPNQIKLILNYINFDIPLRPSLNPFSYVPEPCNTYTVFFPLFHDAGFLGVVIGLFILGCIHQFLYFKYKYCNRRIWWYIYAISIYPLIMTVFEDAYFSSIGFWVTLWIPVIAYATVNLSRR